MLQKAFNTAMAKNPMGAAALAITGVVIALKSLCDWLDKAKQKAHEAAIEAEKAEQTRYNETAGIREQIHAWAELNAIQEKNAKQTDQQEKLESKIRETLRIQPQDDSVATNKRKTFQQEILDVKERAGYFIALEDEKQKAIDKTNKSIQERIEWIKDDAEWRSGNTEENIKSLLEKDKELKRLNETLESQKKTLESIRQARLELQDINEKDFVANSAEAEMKKEANAGSDKEDPLQKTIREQDERLMLRR